ncbi:hypothetical protein O0235_11760 [Tepidiforma flava]|jgi:hypothetical protein|uniref:Polymer-forming cytoskeletal protein n=1 Tax=Tepidiforma flava TaxID=3004094 RepID=A0ABY7M556_9CHLR|nr:hypothetical protein [Tepidiforma flava]WBL35447.1 hypothetical protein O0235_11760 [Tepidiforma flava]
MAIDPIPPGADDAGGGETTLAIERSAIRRVTAEQVDIQRSAVGVAAFDRGTIRQSDAGVIVGRSVAVDQVRVGILASPVVRGDVHTLLDLRSAVAIGFGMVLGKVVVEAVRALARKLLP